MARQADGRCGRPGQGVESSLGDAQADAVIAAYEAEGMKVVERDAGEWCVLVLEAAD